MYLHLGKNTLVQIERIVAIFDLDNSSQSYFTRDYLRRAEQNGRVINISEDLPKSFVVCLDSDGMQIVYLSQLSSATLLKRSETMSFE
ncbi:MAG: extracellular matrix regulator RemB [Oscillospiraceae bacterium]|jgi:hypothetical protein